jgi:intracellular sulfur oxidation DsrE/DsrF family protein
LTEKPKAVFLLNSGVKLVTEGSNALEHLECLQAAGVEVFSCRTCIEWFDLEDKVRVGKIASMAAFAHLAVDHEVITV